MSRKSHGFAGGGLPPGEGKSGLPRLEGGQLSTGKKKRASSGIVKQMSSYFTTESNVRFRPIADISSSEQNRVRQRRDNLVRVAMRGHMRSRNRISAATAATAACYLLVDRSQTNGIIGFYRGSLSAPAFVCWVAGFVAATISAPLCAVFFWSTAKRLRHGWILHLSLVPATYALFRASAAMMLFAANEPDLDSLTGHSLLPATALFVICPIAYYASVGVRKIGNRGN